MAQLVKLALQVRVRRGIGGEHSAMTLSEPILTLIRSGKSVAVLIAAASLLSACSVFDDTAEQAPTVPITSCEQLAQSVGFSVVQVGTEQSGPEGSVVPLLVTWGNNGGVHLLCRHGPNGTVTLG